MVSSFLTNTLGTDDQVLDGHVLGLAQPARLAEGEGEQRVAEVFQPGGGGLRRQIAGGVGPLGAVAQQHHAQQPLARLAAAARRPAPPRWRSAVPRACRAVRSCRPRRRTS